MARIRKKRHTGQDVYTAALDRIRHSYEIFDHIAVSFSGGKDSTATLHAVLDVATELGRLPLEVVFFDEECVAPETLAYCERVAARDDVDFRWIAVPIEHRNGCSRKEPAWWPFDPDKRDLWVREPPPQAELTLPGFDRHGMPESNGFVFHDRLRAGQQVGFCLGIRASESFTRYMSVAGRSAEYDNYIAPDPFAPGVYRVRPIYDMSVFDVWTAPAKFDWDYNRAYDIMDKLGISPNLQRVAPPYGEQPMQSLFMWQQGWPEIWDKMSMRVAGARTALRYARTDLYGFGGWEDLRPPEGMTWQQCIAFYTERHDPASRQTVAKRIRALVGYHRRTTRDPIPVEHPHLQTGVSWPWLLMIAMRGDLKGRKNPNARRLLQHDRMKITPEEAISELEATHGTRY